MLFDTFKSVLFVWIAEEKSYYLAWYVFKLDIQLFSAIFVVMLPKLKISCETLFYNIGIFYNVTINRVWETRDMVGINIMN